MLDTDNQLDFNAEFAAAFDLLENTPQNLFITGEAGTGKSTLLQYFREHTTKNVVVLAPTGVAAVNVKGQTIHSFFRFKPDITPETVASIRIRKNQLKIYKNIDAIIIDEISMVRADLFDCIDVFMRLHGPDHTKPFGGVQMIVIGDLFQLPPVVTNHDRDLFSGLYAGPYFFYAKAYQKTEFARIELKKIYRQKEESFIKLLNMIRNDTLTPQALEMLNRRYNPQFQSEGDDFYIYLTTTNALADRINEKQLNLLNSKEYVYEGDLMGDFPQKVLPTHETLQMKIGAQVMLLNNDPEGRWINGSIGRITDFNQSTETVRVELSDDGQTVDVRPYTWEMFRFFYNEDTEALESEEVGAFRQFPIRFAWAVTIHKSQGKTFSKVIIDMGYGTFAHGQAYVALSRCVSLEGVVLRKQFRRNDIRLDPKVVAFMAKEV